MFEQLPYEVINGTEGGGMPSVALYGLSFCVHCKEGKELLERLGLPFAYTQLDLLPAPVRRPVLKELRELYGKPVLYPVLGVNGSFTFGYDEDTWTKAVQPQ